MSSPVLAQYCMAEFERPAWSLGRLGTDLSVEAQGRGVEDLRI